MALLLSNGLVMNGRAYTIIIWANVGDFHDPIWGHGGIIRYCPTEREQYGGIIGTNSLSRRYARLPMETMRNVSLTLQLSPMCVYPFKLAFSPKTFPIKNIIFWARRFLWMTLVMCVFSAQDNLVMIVFSISLIWFIPITTKVDDLKKYIWISK